MSKKSNPHCPQLPQTFPRFLELPGEVRNRIYHLHLVDPYGIILGISRGLAKEAGLERQVWSWLNDNRQRVHIQRFLALSLVNRQIHQESHSIFFAANRFLFPTTRYLANCTETWPKKVLSLITAVDTKTRHPDPCYYSFEMGSLACLSRFPNLRTFYMSSWVECGAQGLMGELLESYLPDLMEGCEAVVENTQCFHCQGLEHERQRGVVHDEREWWVWKRKRGGEGWDVVKRRGGVEIERVGWEMRRRPLPPEWALSRLLVLD